MANKSFSARKVNIEGSLDALESRAQESEKQLNGKVNQIMDVSKTLVITPLEQMPCTSQAKRSYALRKTTIKLLEKVKLYCFDTDIRYNDIVEEAVRIYCLDALKRAGIEE